MGLSHVAYVALVVAGGALLILGAVAGAVHRRRRRHRRAPVTPFEPRPGFRILHDAQEIEVSAARAANRDYELAMRLLLRGAHHMPGSDRHPPLAPPRDPPIGRREWPSLERATSSRA